MEQVRARGNRVASLAGCLAAVLAALVSSSSGALPGPPSLVQSDGVDSFLEHLVSLFSDLSFCFVFHVDDAAPYLPSFRDYFAPGVEAARLVVVHPEGVALVPRPIGSKFMHVVLLRKPSGFLSFVAGRRSVRPPDRAVFVSSGLALAEEEALGEGAFWRRRPNRLHRLGSTAFAVERGGGLDVYDVCHFCGPLTGVLRPTGAWGGASLSAAAFARLDLFPDNWSDLRGHELRVLFVPFPPVIWCRRMTRGHRGGERVCVGGASGPEGKLLEVASRNLNFTARLVDFSSTEETSGDANASLWDAMVRALPSAGDLAVGDVSITAARTHLVQFTQVFNREPHTFAILRSEGAAPGVSGPFSRRLWLCLAGAWGATALLLAALHASWRVFPECLWATGSMLLGQGVSATPAALRASRPSRTMLLSWCALCFVLASLYESNLVSSLVNPAPPDDPSTLEGLLVNRYDLVTPRSSLFAVRGLVSSTDPVYRAAGRRMRVLDRAEDCVALLVESSRREDSKVALMAEHSFLRWGLPRMLPEGVPSSLLRLGNDEILAYGQAWALRRDAMALAPALSLSLSSASASGLPRHWMDTSLRHGLEAVGPYRARDREERALPLQLFSASLRLWAGGLAAAAVALLAEVLAGALRAHRGRTIARVSQMSPRSLISASHSS